MISILVSLGTLGGMWLVSRKRWEGWAVGIANQAVWAVLIVQTRQWGLFLLTGALLFIYTRALLSWRGEVIDLSPADDRHDHGVCPVGECLDCDLSQLHALVGVSETPDARDAEAAIWQYHAQRAQRIADEIRATN